MPFTLAAVDAFANTLPGVAVGTKWRRRTWIVGGTGFAWERPLTKADLGRLAGAPPPLGDLLAVRVESLDAKDALLSMAPPGFFTIEHFNGYPAILIELRRARAHDVRAAIASSHRAMAARASTAKASRPRPATKRRSTRRAAP